MHAPATTVRRAKALNACNAKHAHAADVLRLQGSCSACSCLKEVTARLYISAGQSLSTHTFWHAYYDTLDAEHNPSTIYHSGMVLSLSRNE